MVYQVQYWNFRFFGLWDFNLNLSLLWAFWPSWLRPLDVVDVYNWFMNLAWTDDVVDYLDFDNYFEYQPMFDFLTGNAMNPFGWFHADFYNVINAITSNGATFMQLAYAASEQNQWWEDTFGVYFEVYRNQQIYPAIPFIAFFVHQWTTFTNWCLQMTNWWSTFWLGIEMNCPGKAWHVTMKWFRLSLWLPTWLSIILVAPVRVIMIILYIPYVTLMQVLASISNFFIGIKNYFDNLIWGHFYSLINFLWPFFFIPLSAVWFLLFMFIWGSWWLTVYMFNTSWWIFQWWEALFWHLTWGLYGWFNWMLYYPMYALFWVPNGMWWLWKGFWALLFKPLDDLCWVMWDISDDFADWNFEIWKFPNWQPGWFEIPLAIPYMLLTYVFGIYPLA